MGSVAALNIQGRNKARKAIVQKNTKASKKKDKVIDVKFGKNAQNSPEEAAKEKNTSESPLSARQREELVITYRLKARKLARSILRKWHARLDLQEVDSVVDLSLCEAVKRFNPKMGASFMTFLFYHLRGNLIRAVTTAASAHMIPLLDLEAGYAMNQEISESSKQNPARGVNAIEIAEALCGHDYPLPDEVVFKRELINLSQSACGKLDELAREVISRIYIQGQQLIDIANSLGYSRCHISRVKKKALETLYHDLSEVMGIPADAPKPNFDDEDSAVKSDRRKIFRRRPRSKKAQQIKYDDCEKLAVGAH